MTYSELLTKYIEESGLSLGEIAIRLSAKNINIDRSYISKLKNGNKPPASEDVTRALAEVLGANSQELLMASYIEKAPKEVKGALEEFNGFRTLFSLIRNLSEYLEFYRNHGIVQEDILERIVESSNDLKNKMKYEVFANKLITDPEYASDIIKNLKNRYFPFSDSIILGSTKIDFSEYVNERGNSIRQNQFEKKQEPYNDKSLLEQAAFEEFINNPEHGIFFKDYLNAPEERKEEMRIIFRALMEKENGRKPGDRQGE